MVDYSTAAWIKIILALVIAFVISFIATPLVKNFAVKVGAIDIPDKKRHIHSHPIPRMGGLAIFIGFLISVLLFANITTQVRGILVGAILIAVVGAIDDVLNLNAWLKFGVQILAAVIAVLSGIIINVVTNPLHITSSQAITIGILSVPVTILWIVGCTNSVNLIDGLDGLACGVSAIASLTMLVVSMLVSDSNSNVATILAALCGACLGFIPYNLNPAKIFMGDTGALLLGYILATASVIGMFKFYAIVTFIVETLMGVYRHNGLLKASIISATNAHRLGANEAPPAIISSFLGKQLSDLLQKLEETDDDELFNLAGKQALSLDIPQIPELMLDNTDRNRTSPFAFTGNRFEFRAVGSQANCAAAMIVLNTAVAEALTNFKTRVDALIATGVDPTKAIVKVLRQDIKTCKPIHFEGNGYSDEWKAEAQKRGLDVESSAPLMLDNYVSADSIKMFTDMNVLSEPELRARLEIKEETYTKKIQIEARIFGDLCLNHIIPVATRYQSQLIDNVHKVKEIFPPAIAEKVSANNMVLIQKISEHSSFITENVEKLINARKVANKLTDEREKAIAYHDTVANLIETIRYHVDKLELIVDDELWPLPKYREMLFIR